MVWYHAHENSVPIENEIVWAYQRQINETVTLKKHVSKYKHKRKWMVEFLSISKSCGIKFARDNSIHMTKSINYH